MLQRLNAAITRFSRWHDLLAIGALVGAVTFWFADVLFGGRLFYARDIFNYHYPMKRIVAEAIRGGEWPMWSPYFAAGQPLAANPAYEVFYPPQLLILLSDFHLGMTLHIVFHFYLCAIGLFLLLRSFQAGTVASLLGAVAYTLGGPFFSLIRTLPFLFSMAWAPLIFLFARRFLLTRSRRDAFVVAVFGGLQALVAEPTTMLQTWMIVGAYAAYRALREPQPARGRALRRNAGAVLAMGAGSAVVAAAQLIPLLDFSRDTVRGQGMEWALVAKWSLAPARVMELFYPLVFQSLSDFGGRQWIASMYAGGEPFVANFYPGFLVGILFVAGIVAWRRGTGFVLAVCAISYIVAIGEHTPLLRFLYDIGIFSTMRFPEKFAMGASLVVVIWAALTADLLFRGDSRVRRAVLYVTAAWFVIAFFLILVSAQVLHVMWIATFLRGVILLLILWAMRRWRTPGWGALLVLITIVDVVHLRAISPTITREYFEPPPVTQQLSPDKDEYRIFHHAEWEWLTGDPNADLFFAHPSGRWWSQRSSLMTRNGAWWGYRYVLDRDFDQTLLKPTDRFVFAMFELFRSGRSGWEETLMSMSNAWYRGRFRDAAAELQRTNADWPAMMPLEFIPTAERYPRYYFADRIEPVADVADFIDKVAAGNASRRMAFVQWPPFEPARGVVRAAAETMRTIRIEAEAEGRSLLVLSVTPHKYWRAHVNGQPAEPRPVNIGYQALELPAGRHIVELEYWNPLVVPSMVISIVAFLAMIAGIVTAPRIPLPIEEVMVIEPESEAAAPPSAPARKRRKSRR